MPAISRNDRLKLQSEQHRRDLLANLSREYTLKPTAGNALRLASGEWKCGEYEPALRHFVAARDASPENPEVHIALVYAASMLGLRSMEVAALEFGLRSHPRHPRLLLHAARRLIPDDIATARALLRKAPKHPMCAQFDAALAAVEAGTKPSLDACRDDRDRARLEGLQWVLDHGATSATHAGLPIDVLERALAAAPDHGLTLECGVYFGRSLRLIAADTTGPVHGFDSFQGLPEAWTANEAAGAYSTGGQRPAMPGNVTLHAGWFEDTLTPFLAANPGPVRLLHVDCDIYSSTRTVLTALADRLVPGSILLFDDFLGYPGYAEHELKAFEELVRERGIGWELLAAHFLGREVAIRITRV